MFYWHTCSTDIHVLLTYMFYWHTCTTDIHVLLTYMFYWHTCTTDIHVLLTYMYYWHYNIFICRLCSTHHQALPWNPRCSNNCSRCYWRYEISKKSIYRRPNNKILEKKYTKIIFFLFIFVSTQGLQLMGHNVEMQAQLIRSIIIIYDTLVGLFI